VGKGHFVLPFLLIDVALPLFDIVKQNVYKITVFNSHFNLLLLGFSVHYSELSLFGVSYNKMGSEFLEQHLIYFFMFSFII